VLCQKEQNLNCVQYKAFFQKTKAKITFVKSLTFNTLREQLSYQLLIVQEKMQQLGLPHRDKNKLTKIHPILLADDKSRVWSKVGVVHLENI